ncbi:unnamed protein product [Rhizoctonia solani]|uniref:Uncharacterized protein n=1 Tax=Rhizoctonia solani TaxID=456999 RepID=A0A8H2Y0H7_9AGAM|nr:unnamed protein product [Rhizoctonia solani]
MTLTPSPAFYSHSSFFQPEQLFPATEMILSLLQELELLVSSSRHGLRLLHKLVERAWDIYIELNQRISKVETTNNWDDYDVYTKAIDPLEQVLLEVVPAIYDRPIDTLTYASSEDLIESVEKWFVNNHIICQSFRRLGTIAELQLGLASSSRDIGAEIMDANSRDHSDLFNELLDEILYKVPQCTQPNLRGLLKYVASGLQNARNTYANDTLQLVDEQWCIDSVKCAMLTRGILINLIQEPSPHVLPNDSEWGGLIWTRVLGMVLRMNTALSPGPNTNAVLGLPQQYQPAEQSKPSLTLKVPTTESPYLSVPLHSESKRKSRADRGLSVCTQFDDPSWTAFKSLQESFPDPHTPTHTQRLSRYRTYSPATAESISPAFSPAFSPAVSFSASPVIAHTPAVGWLPGLRTALALRTSASLPHAHSVCGRLPLYRFLGLGFRTNS